LEGARSRLGSLAVSASGRLVHRPAVFYVQPEERCVGQRLGEVGDVAVGGVVEKDDICFVAEMAEPLRQLRDAVVQDPPVGRQVDQTAGRLVAEQMIDVKARAVAPRVRTGAQSA
jgi:hypothetical protein